MNEEVKTLDSSIDELYNLIMDKPKKVYEIFKDFFGEDKVDIQGYISKEEFKNWLINTSIIDIISTESRLAKYSDDTWHSILEKTLSNLEEEILQDILPALTLLTSIRKIARLKFNNIFILVYFPKVRITNEHDRFVDIENLFAKVDILWDGSINGRFTLNRSKYSLLHMSENYMHSHIHSIPTNNFTQFKDPCLGRGPIVDTISNLSREFDENIWSLFCLELSKYVTVESLTGVPYHYLENLGSHSRIGEENTFFIVYNSLILRRFSIGYIREFTKHFIKQGKLKFNYNNGSYSIGMSYTEYMILISNEFIKWYNNAFNKKIANLTFETLERDNILSKCIIVGNKIYREDRRRELFNYTEYVGKKVCTFKGKDYNIEITDIIDPDENNKVLLLDKSIALYILNIILKILNYRYGRNKAICAENQDGTDVEYL